MVLSRQVDSTEPNRLRIFYRKYIYCCFVFLLTSEIPLLKIFLRYSAIPHMVWILWGLVLHAGPEMHPCYLGQLCPLMDKVHFDSTLKKPRGQACNGGCVQANYRS